MDGYTLEILDDEQTKYFKEYLTKKYDFVYYKESLTRFPILYLPKYKYDFCYYLNDILEPNTYYYNGITYSNFINKQYNVVAHRFYKKYKNDRISRRMINEICVDDNTNKIIHDVILLHLQNAYILLKQILDFTDINQYMLIIYANVIL